MIEVNEHTGLTRITCDACATAIFDTTFEATQPHQEHFDPVEEIEWHRVDGEIRCPECFSSSNEKGERKTMTTTTNGTNEATEGTKQHPIKLIKRTKNLGTPLTHREKGEKGELVAHLVQRIGEKEEAKKNAGAQLKAEIDQLKAELKSASLEISCGVVFRDVQILEKHIYQTGTYQEVRVDTGEVIIERALTEKERQLEVPLGNSDHADESDDDHDSDTEEGPRNWTPDETDEPSEDFGGNEAAPPSDVANEAAPEPVLSTEKKRKGRKGKAAASEGAES